MANTIPAVEKAVAVLDILGARENGATQAELVELLRITPSTCYRILQTLLEAGWIRKRSGKRFDLAGGMLAAAMKLVDRPARLRAAQPILERLAAETGLCAKLSRRACSACPKRKHRLRDRGDTIHRHLIEYLPGLGIAPVSRAPVQFRIGLCCHIVRRTVHPAKQRRHDWRIALHILAVRRPTAIEILLYFLQSANNLAASLSKAGEKFPGTGVQDSKQLPAKRRICILHGLRISTRIVCRNRNRRRRNGWILGDGQL